MHSSLLSKSTSTATATSTSTTTSVSTPSGFSRSELATGQRQQGLFVGLSTTARTPESTQMPANYQQHEGLRLLAEVSASLINPFAALAAHPTVSFNDDDYQEQSDDSLSLANEPLESAYEASQLVEGRATTTRTTTSIPKQEILPSINDHFQRALSGTVPEAALTAITGELQLLTGHHLMGQKPDPTDKWIIRTSDPKKPFKCGYEGCGKLYNRKQSLRLHFAHHTGISRFRCYLGDCTGKIMYRDQHLLDRHIRERHTLERPFQCDDCKRRFGRKDRLKSHRRVAHYIKYEKNRRYERETNQNQRNMYKKE